MAFLDTQFYIPSIMLLYWLFLSDCKLCDIVHKEIFLIPFYLLAVQIHSANGVKLLEA
jgi:hypothetical protein